MLPLDHVRSRNLWKAVKIDHHENTIEKRGKMSFLYHFESPRENYSDAAGGAFPNGFLLDNPPLSWGASTAASRRHARGAREHTVELGKPELSKFSPLWLSTCCVFTDFLFFSCQWLLLKIGSNTVDLKQEILRYYDNWYSTSLGPRIRKSNGK